MQIQTAQANAFDMLNRRTIRSIPNPLDRCTIVSIFPQEIREVKYTTIPSTYYMGPGTVDSPATLVVEPASWWRDFDVDQPLIEVPNSSIQVADGFVKDYSQGLLGCDMGSRMPGLFYILGETKAAEIKTKHKSELDKAEVKQRAWFAFLVKLGDSYWSRLGGNPMGIPDLCKLAAEQLGMNDKPWMKDASIIQMIKCIACGNIRNPEFPICPHCKAVVDKDKAKLLGLTFAGA